MIIYIYDEVILLWRELFKSILFIIIPVVLKFYNQFLFLFLFLKYLRFSYSFSNYKQKICKMGHF